MLTFFNSLTSKLPKLTIYIQDSSEIPAGYGLVRICTEKYHTAEYSIIPLCFIKRYLINLLAVKKIYSWEKEILDRQDEIYTKGFTAGKELGQQLSQREVANIIGRIQELDERITNLLPEKD